ncbi:PC-esterase domain-containing protein 1A-like [Pseudochaenichthys georgianus]|nr:PC-esterase domain-containing protein 1A-like [Pseudochaenichthys georgianus]
MDTFVMQSQARQLLHNKFVLVLGGSVQRSMYKDLVLLLQRDKFLTLPQLKSKGEFSFEQDCLVEGGRLGPLTNGTGYREVRQYRSDHHLLRFYFLTRIYSPYMESILEDLREGLKPDVVIVSSCVWDITRYGPECLEQYKENLHKFFSQIKALVGRDCLMLWTLAMPLAKKIKGGFLVPEVSHLAPSLCYDLIEANFYCSQLADAYGLDVLDLHFHFRFSLQHRMPDGVHWDALAHRRISSLLLGHAADAWGVHLHAPPSHPGQVLQGYREDFGQHLRPDWPSPRALIDSAPLQRYGSLRYQQRHSSDPFQHLPTNSGGAEHIGALQHHARHHFQGPPLQHVLCGQQNSAAAGVSCSPSLLPVQHQYPLPPANPWLSQRVHPQARAPWSQDDSMLSPEIHALVERMLCGGLKFLPPSRQDDHCMRRGRPNFRSHPYPPILTPRHPTHGW